MGYENATEGAIDAALAMRVLPAVVEAQFKLTTNGGTITITKYTGSGGAVVIPNSTNDYLVTSIGDQFSFCTGLSSITFGNNTLASAYSRKAATTTQINE